MFSVVVSCCQGGLVAFPKGCAGLKEGRQQHGNRKTGRK
jgi:hypothetical protein